MPPLEPGLPAPFPSLPSLAVIRRATIRGSALSIASGLGTRLLGLVGTLVVTHFVAPAEFGEVAAATVLALTANQFSNLGVGTYVIAHPHATRRELFHASALHLLLGCLAFTIVLVFGSRFVDFEMTPHLLRYLPGLVLAAALERINFMPDRVLIRRMEFGRLSLIKGAGELAYTAVSVAGAVLGFGGMAIVAGNVVRSALRLVLLLATVGWREWIQPARFDRRILRDLLNFGAAVFLAGLATFAIRRWDTIIVAGLHGAAVCGFYALAFSLADIPSSQVGEQISDVLQAALARAEGGDRRRALVRALGLLAIVMAPMAVGLGAVGLEMESALLDRRWQGVGPMVVVLAAISFPRPLCGTIAAYMQVRQRQWLCLGLEVLTFAGMLAALFGLGRLGPLWACGAVAGVYLLRLPLSALALRQSEGITMRETMLPLAAPLAASALMAAAVAVARGALHAAAVPPVASLVLCVVAGAASYPLALWLVSPARFQDAVAVARSGLR
jgi:lipopolysaccharide exporter